MQRKRKIIKALAFLVFLSFVFGFKPGHLIDSPEEDPRFDEVENTIIDLWDRKYDIIREIESSGYSEVLDPIMIPVILMGSDIVWDYRQNPEAAAEITVETITGYPISWSITIYLRHFYWNNILIGLSHKKAWDLETCDILYGQSMYRLTDILVHEAVHLETWHGHDGTKYDISEDVGNIISKMMWGNEVQERAKSCGIPWKQF